MSEDEHTLSSLVRTNHLQHEHIATLEARYKALETGILKVSRTWEEHPDDYDGPCECKLCLSYGEPG